MKHTWFNRAVSVFVALLMVVTCNVPVLAYAAETGDGTGLAIGEGIGLVAQGDGSGGESDTQPDGAPGEGAVTVNGGDIISEDGTYYLAEKASGTITIGDGLDVEIVGNSWDENEGAFIEGSNYKDLHLAVGNESTLTIKNVYITLELQSPDSEETSCSAVTFNGKGYLNIEGHNLIDEANGYSPYAAISVDQDDDVTFGGNGILWGYKHAMGAYIGSDGNVVSGKITINSGTWLIKGSKTGALIGNDVANSEPGDITINGGAVYLKGVARGSLIGASAQGQAPNVTINGGLLQLLSDYSGAGIGSESAERAGTLTVNGGSIMCIATKNSQAYWLGPDMPEGKDAAIANTITAAHDTKMMAFDASAYADADTVNVYLDGASKPFYSGGLYEWVASTAKNPTGTFATLENWAPNTAEHQSASCLIPEQHLYLWLSKQDHTMRVNDDDYTVIWNEDDQAFEYYKVHDGEDYAITSSVSPASSGTVNVKVNGVAGATTAKAGDVVAVSAEPADGYLMGEIAVASDEGNTPVEVSENGTFTMPTGPVTITQNFVKWDYQVTAGEYSTFGGWVQLPISIRGLDGKGITELTISGSHEQCMRYAEGNNNRYYYYFRGNQNPTWTPAAGATAEGSFDKGNWSVTVKAAEGETLSDGTVVTLTIQSYGYYDAAQDVWFAPEGIAVVTSEGSTGDPSAVVDFHAGTVHIDKENATYPVKVTGDDHGTGYLATRTGYSGDYTETDAAGYQYPPSGLTRTYNIFPVPEEGYAPKSITFKGDWTGAERTVNMVGQISCNFIWPGNSPEPTSVSIEFAESHTITVDNSKSVGGTISTNMESALPTASVRFSWTADAGYDQGILHWSYTDPETGEPVEDQNPSRGSSLMMPDADITVWMEFAQQHTISVEGITPEGSGLQVYLSAAAEGWYDSSSKPYCTPGNQFYAYVLDPVSTDYNPVGNYAKKMEYSTDGGETWTQMSVSSQRNVSISGENGTVRASRTRFAAPMPDADVIVRAEMAECPTVQAASGLVGGSVQVAPTVVNASTNMNGPGEFGDSVSAPVTLYNRGRVYLKATPDEGYRVTRVYVEAPDGTQADLTQNTYSTFSDGAYYDVPAGTEGVYTAYAEFSNSEEADLVIAAPKDLYDFIVGSWNEDKRYIGQKVVLANDIDMSEFADSLVNEWGSGAYDFQGTFDGQGHTISNMPVELMYSTICAEIRDLTIEGTITKSCGAFATQPLRTTFENCVNKCDMPLNWGTAAGICNNAQGCTFRNCVNYGDLASGNSNVGGIVVNAGAGTVIESCANYGNLSGAIVGGIASQVSNGGATISSCVNKGNIVAQAAQNCDGVAGGIVAVFGLAQNSAYLVRDCYNVGNVTATFVDGADISMRAVAASGIATGYQAYYDAVGLSRTIENCYNSGTVTCSLDESYASEIFNEKVWHQGEKIVSDGTMWTVSNSFGAAELAGLEDAATTLGDAYGTDWLGVNVGKTPILTWEGQASTLGYAWYLYADGDDYVISSGSELAELATIVNGTAPEGLPIAQDDFAGKTVKLAADVDLSAYADWTPIGTAGSAFAGTFDGAGNSVSGLAISTGTGGYKGLFGNSVGTVKDLGVSGAIGTADAYIASGADNIGGAVGYNGGTVSGVTGNVAVFVKSGSIYAVGGVVGQNGPGATVAQCINKAEVNASKHSGGVVGRNYGAVSQCVNTGNVTGNQGGKDGIGGIVGCAGDKNSTYANAIDSCYNTGTITNNGGRWHGGIAGFADSATTVTNCYDAGQITPGHSWNWNPICGHVDSATSGNYPSWANNYSLAGLNAGDGTAATKPLTIGTALSAEEMASATFVARLGEESWLGDFAGGDAINGGFPVLAWQGGRGVNVVTVELGNHAVCEGSNIAAAYAGEAIEDLVVASDDARYELPAPTVEPVDAGIAVTANADRTFTVSGTPTSDVTVTFGDAAASRLGQALEDADAALAASAVSEDGSDVADGTPYATAAATEALREVIAAAQAVCDDPASSQMEVVSAEWAVRTATASYKMSLRTASVDRSQLAAAIEAAQADLGATPVSADGAGIEAYGEYATQQSADELAAVIAAAKSAYEAADSTQGGVDVAAEALNGAVAAFDAAKLVADPAPADVEAADGVAALIEALPEAQDATSADVAGAKAAQEAYDALTPEQKLLVPDGALAKLQAVTATSNAAAAAEESVARAACEAAGIDYDPLKSVADNMAAATAAAQASAAADAEESVARAACEAAGIEYDPAKPIAENIAAASEAASAKAEAARIDIANAAVTVASATYTGSALKPAVSVAYNGAKLAAGTDFDVSYANNVKAGTAVVLVKGKGAYSGAVAKTFTVAKAANKLAAKAKKATQTAKYGKKTALKAAKVFKVTSNVSKGKVTYKKVKGNAKITVASNGKVTVKKGLKKGTYTVKVKLTSKATANYKAASKTVTFKVKVK